MKLNEKLKNRRIDLGLTLEQVGDYVGVGKSTVRKWETGMIKDMKRSQIAKYAEILNISPMTILGVNDSSDLTEIPMDHVVFDDYFPLNYCTNLSAGSFEELLQAEPDSVVYVPIVFQGRRKRLHAFKVNGTSMNNVIEDGSIVVAEDTADGGINFKDGTIVVAFLDGKATVKRLYRAEDHVTLMPDSTDKAHMPITVTPDQQLYIIGRVIWHMNPDNIAELRY